MNAREHIERAELILQHEPREGEMAELSFRLDAHLRIAEAQIELARLERPNSAADLIAELKPLLVDYLSPYSVIRGAPIPLPSDAPEETK